MRIKASLHDVLLGLRDHVEACCLVRHTGRNPRTRHERNGRALLSVSMHVLSELASDASACSPAGFDLKLAAWQAQV